MTTDYLGIVINAVFTGIGITLGISLGEIIREKIKKNHLKVKEKFTYIKENAPRWQQ